MVSIVCYWKWRQYAPLSWQIQPDSGRSCEEWERRPCQHVCITIRVYDTGCAQSTGRKCPFDDWVTVLRENSKTHSDVKINISWKRKLVFWSVGYILLTHRWENELWGWVVIIQREVGTCFSCCIVWEINNVCTEAVNLEKINVIKCEACHFFLVKILVPITVFCV